ncbi:hypothetical protein FOA52_013698 [Chlamydomonas sp. UWO 241]|nr:hypothetical protein FOA52_013698 [Chlamydomonas sp. UWO 241]
MTTLFAQAPLEVIRVVSRLRALDGDPTKLGQVHTAMADEMLDTGRPGCFNQAVMELGATVCRPANPSCDACPVSHSCRAHKAWTAHLDGGGSADIEDAPRVTNYPGKKAVKAKREESVAVAVLQVVVRPSGSSASVGSSGAGAAAASQPQPKKRQRTMFEFAAPAAAGASGVGAESGREVLARGERYFLLVQRPEEGLLAGLWEFPGVMFEGEQSRSQRVAASTALLQALTGVPASAMRIAPKGDVGVKAAASGKVPAGLRLSSSHDAGTHVHVFSHIKQTSHVEVVTVLVDSLDELRACAAAAAAAAAAATGGVSTAGAAEVVDLASAGSGGGDAESAGEEEEDEDDVPGARKRGRGAKGAAKTSKQASKGAEASTAAAGGKGGKKAAAPAAPPGPPPIRWVRAAEVAAGDGALSTLTRKIHKLATGGGK